jgi:hypothetical protein
MRQRLRVLATLAGALLLGTTAATQNPPGRDQRPAAPAPQGTATVAGTLVSADSGRAVRQARVTLSGGDVRFGRSVLTDDQGGFRFANIPAGQFTLSASKPGYLDVVYGQRRPGTGRPGTPLQIRDGDRLDKVALVLPKAGVVTGTALDELGDPVIGLTVRAMRWSVRTGERTLIVAGSAVTDDRGVYRIAGLTPADYVVSAIPREPVSMAMAEEMKARVADVLAAAAARGGANDALTAEARAMAAVVDTTADEPTSGFAPVFAPGTPQLAAATIVPLGVGEERANVDLRMQAVRLARVSGMLVAPGPVPAGAQVTLVDRSQPVAGLTQRSARVGADGRFAFSAVPPGQYTLFARATFRTGPPVETPVPAGASKEAAIAAVFNAPPTDALWATSEVAVSGEPIADLALALQPGLSISAAQWFSRAQPREASTSRGCA